jgi:hypothetical protein
MGDSQETYTQRLMATDTELEELEAATKAYNEALKGERDLKYANITASLEVYEALLESEGGLERFRERAQFFIDKFVPESVKLGSITKTVTQGFTDLNITMPKSRREFYDLVGSLDLTTKAGRETYSSLMDLAPAFDSFMTQLIDSVGLGESAIASAVNNVITGAENAGADLAQMIVGGFQQAAIQSGTSQITSIITSEIITPVLLAMQQGAAQLDDPDLPRSSPYVGQSAQ